MTTQELKRIARQAIKVKEQADSLEETNSGTGADRRASVCSPKIVQILIAPNDSTWQGRMMGLDSNGAVYSVNPDGKWEPFVPPLNFQQNDPVNPSDESPTN